MAGKMTSYIEQHVSLAGAEKREEVLELFDNMNRLFPHWVIMTCPVMHPEIHYVSKNGPHVLGHENAGLINLSMGNFFNYVHEADKQDLHACFTHVHDFLESIPAGWHCQYRMIFHYRFKKQNGQHIYIQDEKATLNLPGSGNLYYVLIRDITEEKKFSGVKVDLYKQDQLLNKIREYKPVAERNPLTKREGELVTLIKQGLSTKEIAWYLKISHHTVRNIKSKLFEKYNVNNTVELLNITA